MKRRMSRIRIALARGAAQVFNALAVVFYLLGTGMLALMSFGILADSIGYSAGLAPTALSAEGGTITIAAHALFGAVCMAPALLASAISRYLAEIGRKTFYLTIWTWPLPVVVLLAAGAARGELLSLGVLAGLGAIMVYAQLCGRASHTRS